MSPTAKLETFRFVDETLDGTLSIARTGSLTSEILAELTSNPV